MDSLTRLRISAELYKEHAKTNAFIYGVLAFIIFVLFIKLAISLYLCLKQKQVAYYEVVVKAIADYVLSLIFTMFLMACLFHINGYLTPELQMLHYDTYVNAYILFWAMI